MKLQTKKRIAKEIIIFFSGVLLAFLLFLTIYPYNWIYETKTKKLEDTISFKGNLIDSLSKPYIAKIKKQKWFYDEISKEFNMEDYKTSEENWKRLQTIIDRDSIEYQYKNTWSKDLVAFLNKLGFKNAILFKEYILSNSISKIEKLNYEKISALQNEIIKIKSEKEGKEQKIISFEEQKEISLKSFFVILIILYPLRFLYLLIIWSVKILKQKENN